MERTLSANYSVQRQNKGVLLKTTVIRFLLYILSICPFLLPVLMYNVVSFVPGVFGMYSIIHSYFALVQGSSH